MTRTKRTDASRQCPVITKEPLEKGGSNSRPGLCESKQPGYETRNNQRRVKEDKRNKSRAATKIMIGRYSRITPTCFVSSNITKKEETRYLMPNSFL
ncbi:hypothetical protein BDW74DRAFT_91169 [Aspergillus multicolor]|uniref:uncharacterized protein n=1 Tax=Aspergillus multicolor TaxID=41759 RepID=UPI003CCE3C14